MKSIMLLCVLCLASCSSSVVAPPPVVPTAPPCPAHFSRLTMTGSGMNGRLIHEHEEDYRSIDTHDTSFVYDTYWDASDNRPDSVDFQYAGDTVKLYHQVDLNGEFDQQWLTMIIDTQAHIIRSMKFYWQYEGPYTSYRGLWAEDLPYESDSLGAYITLTGQQLEHSVTALNRTDRSYQQVTKVDQIFDYDRYELWGPMPAAASMTIRFYR